MLELMAAVILFGAAATALLNRLWYYQELAEKARMEYAISAMKSALRIRMATLLVQGQAQQYRFLAEESPVDWLEERPDDYLGVLSSPDIGKLPLGSWYYDAAAHTLVYLVRRGDHFQADSDGRKRVRLRVMLQPNFLNAPDHATDSVKLVLMEPYVWFSAP